MLLGVEPVLMAPACVMFHCPSLRFSDGRKVLGMRSILELRSPAIRQPFRATFLSRSRLDFFGQVQPARPQNL